MRFESLAIHGGRKCDGTIKGVNYPIHLSSTFVRSEFDKGEEFGYSRSNNPTRNNVEQLVAQLENAKYAYAMSSGMAASSLAFSLLKPGEKILTHNDVYGGTWSYITKVLKERNVEHEMVTDLDSYDFDSVSENTRMVFLETPSNPLLTVTDIKTVAERAHAKGLLVVVDNTFMTSYLQRPLELGADVVVYSATKYYAGHSDIIAGLVVTNDDELAAKLKFHQSTQGAILSPFDSFLLARGIRTLPVRMDRAQENVRKIIDVLKDHPGVDEIFWPELETHKGHEIHQKQAKGGGGLFSFLLNKNYDVKVFFEAVEIFGLAVSLGGVESLISHPGSMTHKGFLAEWLKNKGVNQELIRVAVGIEDAQDLIDDLLQAFEKAKKC